MKPPSTTSTTAATRPVTRYSERGCADEHDRLAVEEPLEIRLGGEPLAVTMRTPGHDLELAAGFCWTEGLIRDPDELEAVEPCSEATQGNVVIVRLTEEAMANRSAALAGARRELYLSSSCGLCGKQTLDRIEQEAVLIQGRFTVSRAVLSRLPEAMRAAQATFEQTGGLHAAGLFTAAGELRVLREDVGRHNAVDKVIGQRVLLGEMPIDPSPRAPREGAERPAVLLVSGRASFEIMQKAAMAGIAVVAAVSAPSSLAVDFAARMGMTLVGFLRPGRMNVYHDRGRLVE